MVSVLSSGRISNWRPPRYVVDPGVPVSAAASDAAAGNVWRSQPHVRTVVDFLARSVASIPLRAYERAGETDRRKLRKGEHALAATLAQPAERVTPFRFWHEIIIDWLIYDRWCAVKTADSDGVMRLKRVPAERFALLGDALDEVTYISVVNAEGEQFYVTPDKCVYDRGYSPLGVNGTSPAETLRELLNETRESMAYRRQVWANGARVPAVIERPGDAPAWSPDARQRFIESMRDYLGNGAKAGGVPILEDGMTLNKVDAFTPRDTDDIQARQLSAVEVASAFHVPPELVGFRQGNYSNVREYRQQLYRDVLGPLITALEQTVNVMLTPDLDATGQVYAEFFIDAKLRGSFEEQAAVLQTAVGAPFMTRNEARAMQNRPAIEGGDEIVTPLNVITGGLASPRDTAPEIVPVRALSAKARKEEPQRERMTGALGHDLGAFFDKQATSVLGVLDNRKAMPSLADAWDGDRWNDALAALLRGWMPELAMLGAAAVLERYGSKDDFDPRVMDNYLAVAAASHAGGINRGTYAKLAKLASDPDWRDNAKSVFVSLAGNAVNIARSIGTEAISFGGHDAAKACGLSYKRWRSSGRKDSRHGRLNGETVKMEDVFSNGARWPGDAHLPPGQRVNCRCEATFHVAER